NFLVLAIYMRRRIGRINGGDILTSVAKTLAASVAMSAAAYGCYYLLNQRLGANGFTIRMIEVFVPIAVAGIVFFVSAKLLKISEFEQALKTVRNKIKR
ncbi:MAG: hypothetical protein KF685_13175, partial [Acidobacteria bacterium]|nr:hypothetical protein [Acidobacteriota bacterium]